MHAVIKIASFLCYIVIVLKDQLSFNMMNIVIGRPLHYLLIKICYTSRDKTRFNAWCKERHTHSHAVIFLFQFTYKYAEGINHIITRLSLFYIKQTTVYNALVWYPREFFSYPSGHTTYVSFLQRSYSALFEISGTHL